MKNTVRPSLVKRLALFAPLETLMCLLTLGFGVYGLWGLAAWERNPLASKVTPLIYAFGVWPYAAVLLIGAGLGFWAYQKSRV